MRILQVCLTYHSHIGGIAEHVRNLAERIARKHDVTVFATDPLGGLPKEEEINGVKVKRFRSFPPNNDYFFSLQMIRELRKAKFDIVHGQGYHAIPLFFSRYAHKKKFVVTPHYHGSGQSFIGNVLLTVYRPIGKKPLEEADRIICVSNYEKELLFSHFGIKEKVVVIPNGINLNEFKNLRKKEKQKNHRKVLYVGRLEKYKGVDHLIKALPKLDDDIYLEIVGKGSYKKNLVKLMNKLGVTSRIKFYQDLPRKNLLQKYADADLVVLLSKLEAYSMTIAEALTSGTPCIVAKTSALTEWVDNENCFGISYPINLDELSKLINHVIESNDRAHLKKARREKIQDWDEVVRRLEGIYNSD